MTDEDRIFVVIGDAVEIEENDRGVSADWRDCSVSRGKGSAEDGNGLNDKELCGGLVQLSAAVHNEILRGVVDSFKNPL